MIMVKRYLSLCSLEDALSVMKSSFPAPQRTEQVPIMESVGRVVATPVYASYSVPEVPLSAMDGIAVNSRDTIGASETSPVTLESFARVNTGNIVPPEFDAVIMIEDTWEAGDRIQIRKAAAPGQHVRLVGEDIREGRLFLPRGHLVRAFDIGALATYGVTGIEARAVRIGIIPTGSELVPPGVRPGPGQVVESNTVMAQVFLEATGAACTRFPIVRDDPELIAGTLSAAVMDNDLVIISAGSSAGTRDYTAGVISSLGELLFHGVAVKPGKPVMLGKVQGKPVLGLPGYPLAAQTALREFAAPLLESWGFAPVQKYPVRARLAQALTSDLGFDEFVPVFVGRIGTSLWGTPFVRGPVVQTATVKANGYTHIPAPVEGYEAGTELEVLLTTDPGSIERTLILTGTLDPALDDLANLVHDKGLFIHASNTGNLAGLLALLKKTCHATALSLPAQSLLPGYRPLARHVSGGDEVIFVHIATIGHGIVSREGLGPDDLTKVRFVNTKSEAPSRIILDALLSSRGIDISQVEGYLNEASGPAAVALAIRNGTADAGICTAGIAESGALRFVPVAAEDYELAIRKDMLSDPRLVSLISLIRSPEYRAILEKTGRYTTDRTGTLRCLSKGSVLTDCPERTWQF
jgi:putative molybdopterin biosynthesis protein